LGATTITATTIFAQHEARSALTSDLERSNADLERSNAKLEKLKTNVQALMAENEKLEKKYTNLKRWGFILGLPSIVILFPIILPLFWVQRRKRRLRGGSTAKINSPR
jgi:hypothetical protein